MSTSTPDARSAAPTRRDGPPLPIPITAYAAIAIAGAATYVGTNAGAEPSATLAALQADPGLAQVSAVLLLVSSAPLAVWTAAATHRVRALGARVAGPGIGLVGGMLAVVALALSGTVGWVAAGAAGYGDATLVSAFGSAGFVLGGPVFALGTALLVAGLAVPALLLRLVPRPLAIAGLVVAVCGAVAPFGLLAPALYPLLPVTRFGGLLWCIAVSIALPLPARTTESSR